jgi:hypothetical protein
MRNPFDYRAYRGSSDFDARHNINAKARMRLTEPGNKQGMAGHRDRHSSLECSSGRRPLKCEPFVRCC